ncbi:MAG: nucleoside phosphorylase [Deltaproteobacteria bacterium]|nr:nucleoside phosphorylase [Deltaproteobacteria bacterium]
MQDTSIVRATSGRRNVVLPPNGLMMPVPLDFRECLQKLNSSRVRTLFNFMEVHKTEYRDVPIALAGPFLGAPQGAMLLENIAAMKCRRILCLGWCGSIREDVRIGDVILARSAISDEGTSRHYPLKGVKIEAGRQLASDLVRSANMNSLKLREEVVWSTDAPYRETREKVAAMRKRGAVAVEMELSALYKVAFFRKVMVVGLLVVSDELFTGEWKHGFSDERFHRSRALALDVALQACASAQD